MLYQQTTSAGLYRCVLCRKCLKHNSRYCIAFGMTLPGMSIYKEYDGDPRGNYHQANESLNLKDYLRAIEIYIQCIVELDQQEI